MLDATVSPSQPTAGRPATSNAARPVLGGEAWIVPFEPGGPAWVTVSAPQVRITDRRARRAAVAAA
jgi:hypothetical protein